MKKYTISVIGLGKLGNPILDTLAEHFNVIGIDKYQKNCSYERLGDISFIVVPTPSLSDGSFSSEYVEEVLKKIKSSIPIVIVSTLFPGETDRLQKKYSHLNLIYNPTFVALGSVAYDFTHPDILLIGHTRHYIPDILFKIYQKIHKTSPKVCCMKAVEAEIAKLTLNCYITTKITFANQVGNLCHKVGANADVILEAVGNDSRVGNKYFHAGLGYGGPCFPRDNQALSTYCIKNECNQFLFKTVDFLNKSQVDVFVKQIESIRPKPKSIGFVSISYKEGTDLTECSQLADIYDALEKKGYPVMLGDGQINIDWRGLCKQ